MTAAWRPTVKAESDKAKKTRETYIAQSYTREWCAFCGNSEPDINGDLFCPLKGEPVAECGTCDCWEQA